MFPKHFKPLNLAHRERVLEFAASTLTPVPRRLVEELASGQDVAVFDLWCIARGVTAAEANADGREYRHRQMYLGRHFAHIHATFAEHNMPFRIHTGEARFSYRLSYRSDRRAS